MGELPQLWSWILQLGVLSGLIYVFLLLARESRGNRVVQVLVTGGMALVVGLWGLSESLALAELQHILSSVTGFVVVVLAIVFQPELRRAMSHLSRFGTTIGGRRLNSVAMSQVVAAAQSMGRRRRGALIAFERESSLEHWCERGVALDSRVDRLLLESIFEPSGALHDGGVVVRGDRIVASSCVFPLTENPDLSQSHGTRHRAALGLTEETDAVTLVVSEETGRLSIASGGNLIGPIAPGDLEAELRRVLGGAPAEDAPRKEAGVVTRAIGLVRHLAGDLYWVTVSAVLAAGLLYVAHGQVAFSDDVRFELVLARAAEFDSPDPVVRERLTARPGRIVVVLEPSDYAFAGAGAARELDLVVAGSRARIESFRTEAAAELRVTNADAPVLLEPTLLDWNTETLGLSMRWKGDLPPRMNFVRVSGRSVELLPSMLPIDSSAVRSSMAVAAPRTLFHPARVEVNGPVETLNRLLLTDAEPLFAPLVLGVEPVPAAHYPLALAPRWEASGLRLNTPVAAEPLVSQSRRTWKAVDIEIAVVCMEPGRAEELDGWTLVASNQRAQFEVEAIGVVPVGASDEEVINLVTRLSTFVARNIVAYVDVSELPPGVNDASDPKFVRLGVRHFLRRDLSDPESLNELQIDPATLSDWSVLRVTLLREPQVQLELPVRNL